MNLLMDWDMGSCEVFSFFCLVCVVRRVEVNLDETKLRYAMI
jgi:hypothetical protein